MELKYEGFAISGPPASGKSALVREIQKDLPDWRAYSVGDLIRKRHADEMSGLPESERIPLEKYWPTIPDDQQIGFNLTLLKMVDNREVQIADTRYAMIFNPDKILRVWLDAPEPTRARRCVGNPRYPNKTQGEIEDILNKRFSDEVEMGRKLFGVDHRDPVYYHTFLDSGMQTIRQEADQILDCLKGEEKVESVRTVSLN